MVYAVSHTAGRYDEPRLGGRRVGEVPFQRTMTSISIVSPCILQCGSKRSAKISRLDIFNVQDTCQYSLDASGQLIESFSSFQRPVLHVSCINITHVL